MYNPSKRPRHPVTVTQLNDSANLSLTADGLDTRLAAMGTQPGQQALIHAITILREASKQLAA